MNNMKLFGSSGIRRRYSRELLELVFKAGLALGHKYHTVVIAKDTRTSSNIMKHALCTGLLASGVRCFDAGVLPTPVLGFAARDVDAGVMITASHNPPDYNGLKIFNPDGTSFVRTQQAWLEENIINVPDIAGWQNTGQEELLEGIVERYLDFICPDLPRLDGMRIVVDAGGGAASLITPLLLERLGCEVIRLYCFHTGFFPRSPEPDEKNLSVLRKTVIDTKANLGIAHDGDGDRTLVIDEKGHFVNGDQLLCLLAMDDIIHEVVTTVDATMAIDEMGKAVRRTPIGDTYVAEELKNGGDFGGETSGCWIFPRISLCPDGIYAAAIIAGKAKQRLLSESLKEIPVYPLKREKYPGVIENLELIESQLAELQPDYIDRTDGIKLIFPDGWLLIRTSGTEPVTRISVEAKSPQHLQEIYEKALNIVKHAIIQGGL